VTGDPNSYSDGDDIGVRSFILLGSPFRYKTMSTGWPCRQDGLSSLRSTIRTSAASTSTRSMREPRSASRKGISPVVSFSRRIGKLDVPDCAARSIRSGPLQSQRITQPLTDGLAKVAATDTFVYVAPGR
jgi:hypothetical protein